MSITPTSTYQSQATAIYTIIRQASSCTYGDKNVSFILSVNSDASCWFEFSLLNKIDSTFFGAQRTLKITFHDKLIYKIELVKRDSAMGSLQDRWSFKSYVDYGQPIKEYPPQIEEFLNTFIPLLPELIANSKLYKK